MSTTIYEASIEPIDGCDLAEMPWAERACAVCDETLGLTGFFSSSANNLCVGDLTIKLCNACADEARSGARSYLAVAIDCRTCGNTGMVHVRTGVDSYESSECPVCAPISAAHAEIVRLAAQVTDLHAVIATAVSMLDYVDDGRAARGRLASVLPPSPTPGVPPIASVESDTPSPGRAAECAPGDGGHPCISTFSDPPFTHRCAEARLHNGPHRSTDGTTWAWS